MGSKTTAISIFIITILFWMFMPLSSVMAARKYSKTDSLFLQANRLYLVNADSAIRLYNEAYTQYENRGNKRGEMKCLSRLSMLYDDKGNTDTALALSYRAVSIGLDNGYDTILAESYLRLGNLYKEKQDYEHAKSFYDKTVTIGLPNTTNGAWASIGILYSNIEEYDSAFIFLTKSYKYYLSQDTTLIPVLYNISSVTGSLGINSFDRNRPKEGLKYIEESLRISRKIGNQQNIISNLLNLSIAYDMLTLYSNSEKVLNEALSIADSIQNSKLKSRVYLLKSDHYYEIADYKQAYNFLKRYHSLKDSLNKKDYRDLLHKKEMKYANRINKIKLKKLQLEKEHAKLKFTVIIAFTGILFFLITFFLYRKVKIRTAEKKKLEHNSKKLNLRLRNAQQRLLNMEGHLEAQNAEIMKKQKQAKALDEAKMKEVVSELENRKILLTEDWEQYKDIFNLLHPEFLKGIITDFPNLTEGDKRQLIMLKLGYNRKKASSILGISSDSVKRAQQRLANKLKLKDIRELAAFVARHKPD